MPSSEASGKDVIDVEGEPKGPKDKESKVPLEKPSQKDLLEPSIQQVTGPASQVTEPLPPSTEDGEHESKELKAVV